MHDGLSSPQKLSENSFGYFEKKEISLKVSKRLLSLARFHSTNNLSVSLTHFTPSFVPLRPVGYFARA